MTTVTISLPEPLREFVDRQVKKKGYGDASEYFRELLREAQEHEAREHKGHEEDERLDALLLASLDDPRPDIKITPKFWHDIKRRLEERVERRTRDLRKT
jgi:antitoxin ParD1/3/4